MPRPYGAGSTRLSSCLFSAEFHGLLSPSCCCLPPSLPLLSGQRAQGDGPGLGMLHVVWATALPQGTSICSFENRQKRGSLSFWPQSEGHGPEPNSEVHLVEMARADELLGASSWLMVHPGEGPSLELSSLLPSRSHPLSRPSTCGLHVSPS